MLFTCNLVAADVYILGATGRFYFYLVVDEMKRHHPNMALIMPKDVMMFIRMAPKLDSPASP